MKIIIYLLFTAATVSASFSQIGINTDNPQQLFHLDGASSAATTNPATGIISAVQAADDVVVNSRGNVGIGTNSPSTKLHVASGSIKIEDGSQANRKVLISDADGYASWASISGTWFAGLYGGSLPATQTPVTVRQVVNFPMAVISSITEGVIDKTYGYIVVPFTGYYKLLLSSWFSNMYTAYPAGTLYVAYPWVYVNGVAKFQPHVVGLSHMYGVYPTFIQFMKLNAGDVITLWNASSLPYTNAMNDVILIVEFMQ